VIVEFHEQRAVLRCSGDEDFATRARRRRAVSRAIAAERDVCVDLADLAYADASLMVDLAMVARRLRTTGSALHVRGAQPHVLRLIETVGLHRLTGVVVDAPARAIA